MSAADTSSATQASFVALKSRSLAKSGVVTVIDTPSGRLVCEHTVRDERRWMIVSPGSTGDITSAVLKMMHSDRKAV
jgi:hypothetical protein